MELSHNHEDPEHRSESCPFCALLDAAEEEKSDSDESTATKLDQAPSASKPVVEEVRKILVAEILDDPTDNPARGCVPIVVDKKLHQLAESLKLGQQHPILVRPIAGASGKHRYRLVFGFRRTASARLLGWTHIEAKIRILTDEEAFFCNWAEGNREDANDYEIAVGALEAHKHGIPSAAIAKQIGDMKAEDVDLLIAIMTKCPKICIDTFRVDTSQATMRLLETIASIDAGSPEETEQLQIEIWSEERTRTVRQLHEMAEAKRPKPKPPKKKKPERKTLSLREVENLAREVEQASEWYDPIGGCFRPVDDELRCFAKALMRTIRRGEKIAIR